MRARDLRSVVLPFVLGATAALVLNPAPAAVARAGADRSDDLKKQVEELKCLKLGDYQRMEGERAAALDKRLSGLEASLKELQRSVEGVRQGVAAVEKALRGG